MQHQKRFPFHPFLFALYAIISLLAFNIAQVAPSDAWRSLFVVMGGTAVFMLTATAFTRDSNRAGLTASIFLLFFFSFGHILRLSTQLLPNIDFVYHFRVLFSLWMTLLASGVWWTMRILRRDIRGVTRFLNTVAAVSLIWPTLTVTTHVWESAQNKHIETGNPTAMAAINLSSTEPIQELPDIYYIILDGYGRADVLKDFYQLDNRDFLNALADRGFYVAANSHSNYIQTTLALASTMNFTYLDDLAGQVGRTSEDRGPLLRMIQHSQLADKLRQHGYHIVAIPSRVPALTPADADVEMARAGLSTLNDFESLLLANTLPGYVFVSRILLYDMHLQSTLNVFERLDEAAAIPGPKFVYAHVVAPHPPFVLDSEGNYIQPAKEYSMHDGDVYGQERQAYVDGYREQLIYINKRVLAAVDTILANSSPTPIIVLQGDHGPGSRLVWGSVQDTCIYERVSILNAYLVPENVSALLYDSISPVNSFRVILDDLLGMEMGLLPDNSYFSSWQTIYNFVDVTNRQAEQCP
ncbi:MAG: hypothetical protein ACE5E7_12460 [Anaerolineae bacterium]